jgi:carbonic anhydrase/acetyltransferase-like protein (isoleucine patch superfamily)
MMGTDYVQGKYYVYKESGVKIARSARIGHGVVFGKGTVVEEDAEINHATIGRNCVIGRGVRIQESHLYDGLDPFLLFLSPLSSLACSLQRLLSKQAPRYLIPLSVRTPS